jgi:oligoribonuclease NrnB/cAMP/cGMP phosphodiesterase (DHH superfamily)
MAQLTSEELQSIKDLQSKYNQTIFEIGASEAQLIAFQQGIEKLQKAKEGLVSDLTTIEQKESELIKSLQEKYEQGSIDLETGEITLDQ